MGHSPDGGLLRKRLTPIPEHIGYIRKYRGVGQGGRTGLHHPSSLTGISTGTEAHIEPRSLPAHPY